MIWTAEMVRAVMGWKPRDMFLLDRQTSIELGLLQVDPNDPDHRSGRTTEMHLEAAAAALNGERVVIVTDVMNNEILEMCLKADPTAKPTIAICRTFDHRRYAGQRIFYDHHYSPDRRIRHASI